MVRTETYLQILLMLWILWDLYRVSSEVEAALQAYVCGSYASISFLLIDYFAHFSSDASVSYRHTTGEFNPNGLALFLAMGIPLAWRLAARNVEVRGSGRLLRMLNVLYAPLALFAITLTGSRGAIVASAPALLFLLWDVFGSGRAKMIIWLAVIVALIVGLYHLVPTLLIDRLSTLPAEFLEGDLGGRRSVWRDALIIFRQRPFLGIGSGAFRVALSSLAAWEVEKVAHNTFLSILVETGIIGLGLFLAALSRVVLAVVRRREAHFEVWLVALLVWALGAFNLTWEHRKATWLVMLLALASSQAVDE
jgi:O-antigen ligase